MCVRFHSAIQSFEIFMYPCVYFCVRHGIHEFEAFKRVCMCVCVCTRAHLHTRMHKSTCKRFYALVEITRVCLQNPGYPVEEVLSCICRPMQNSANNWLSLTHGNYQES
jgi:hypothetical protein